MNYRDKGSVCCRLSMSELGTVISFRKEEGEGGERERKKN